MNVVDGRTEQIVKENADGYKNISEPSREEDCTERKRKNIQVAEIDFLGLAVGIRNASNGENHHEECPPRGRRHGQQAVRSPAG